MRTFNTYYQQKITKLKSFLDRLQKLMSTGSFQKLSSNKQQQLIQRIERLFRQTKAQPIAIPLKKVWMGLALALGLNMSTASAQDVSFGEIQTNPFGLDTVFLSIPELGDIDGDGDLDLFLSSAGYGAVAYYENTGTEQEPIFDSLQVNPFGLSFDEESFNFLALEDIDGDGDLDIINRAFEYGGRTTNFHENVGTSTAPAFADPITDPFNLSLDSYATTPAFTDIDGDGDLDVFVSVVDTAYYISTAVFYENTGTATEPNFAAPVADPFNLEITPIGQYSYFSIIDFSDIDQDGDMDILVGGIYDYETEESIITFVENIGTATAPSFAPPVANPFGLHANANEEEIVKPEFADIDGDGDEDVFLGSYGIFDFFENTTFAVGIEDITNAVDIVAYPNPTTEKINIDLPFDNALEKVQVLNTLGQVVFEQTIDKHTFLSIPVNEWKNGLYLIQLTNDNQTITKKLMVE